MNNLSLLYRCPLFTSYLCNTLEKKLYTFEKDLILKHEFNLFQYLV